MLHTQTRESVVFSTLTLTFSRQVASQCQKQLTHGMLVLQWMSHWQFGVDYIVITPALFASGNVTRRLQFGNYLLNPSLGEAYLSGNHLSRAFWMFGDVNKHPSVVRKESPEWAALSKYCNRSPNVSTV